MMTNGKPWLPLLALLALALVAGACGATPTPQVVEKEVVVTKEVERVVEKEVVRRPSVEVEFWTTDNEEQRVDLYEAVAQRFMDERPEVSIRIVPIDEATISQRIATAQAANRLPDVVRFGVERVSAFAEILDADAASQVISELGADTFWSGVLDMVQEPGGQRYLAVPYDGWIQAIWYRQDIFSEMGLAPPTTWEAIREACNALAGQAGLQWGITLGTDPGQNYTQQVFEQFAMSNGVFPFEDGEVTLDTPAMVEAIRYYTDLQGECAAPGANYWRQGRQNYITGQSGMLFYSTYVLDDLAGLQEGVEPTVEELAANTGFASEMEGPSGDKATYGQLVTLGIFQGADAEAVDVVKHFLEGQNYVDVLFLAPNGKVPTRKTAVDQWKTHEIFQAYPPEVLETIASAYEVMQRWLFQPGYGAAEKATIGDIEGRLLVPQAIANVLQGAMTPQQAAEFLQTEVEKLYQERQAEAEG